MTTKVMEYAFMQEIMYGIESIRKHIPLIQIFILPVINAENGIQKNMEILI